MSEIPSEPAGPEQGPGGVPTGQPEEPLAGVTDPPPSEPVDPIETRPMPAEKAVVPEPPKALPTKAKRYTGRIVLVYAILLAVLGGAIAAIVVIEAGGGGGGGGSSANGWSDWKPKSGTTAAMTKQIADHVGHEYKLNKKGAQLVAIVPEAPLVTSGTHKVAISNIAIRKVAKNDKGIVVLPSTHTWTYEFCGLGSQCSIASGTPSESRGRLVRREALEVALYTFRSVPSVDTVVAFMPPPPGQQQSTLLYLQKADLQKELSQPLRRTLPLTTPPLPNSPDVQEQRTIDKLTLPDVYSYHLQQLQDASALLVLDPFQS